MTGIFYFPGMLYNHIKTSNLKLPDNLENYNPEEYPHYHVFKILHVGYIIDITSLKDNANIIAEISTEDIKNVTIEQLINKGLWIENSRNIV